MNDRIPSTYKILKDLETAIWRQGHIPPELAVKPDLIILEGLADVLNRYCQKTYLINPGIESGDIPVRAATKVRTKLVNFWRLGAG